ncbi:MAG: hypothetical protein HC882_02705, partial [Acidobacteria bacterium]|nr:hypothetical protein [Acidobacteriota bacterium]
MHLGRVLLQQEVITWPTDDCLCHPFEDYRDFHAYEAPDGTQYRLGPPGSVLNGVVGSAELNVLKIGNTWQVLDSDGTKTVLEQLGTKDLQGGNPQAGTLFVFNQDRFGWYATSITDRNGNSVHIEYWGDLVPEHPEAIRRVYPVGPNAPNWMIETSLYCYTDAGVAQSEPSTTCPSEDLRGVLRQLRSTGPDGVEVRYDFEYEFITIDVDVNGGNVPVLSRVLYPADAEGVRPEVRYYYDEDYSDLGTEHTNNIENGREFRAALVRIDHPHGSSSVFGYGSWHSTSRPTCTILGGAGCSVGCGENQYDWHYPKMLSPGVVNRTIYPYGAGQFTQEQFADPSLPHVDWSWARKFYYQKPLGSSIPEEYANEFALLRPDGSREVSHLNGTVWNSRREVQETYYRDENHAVAMWKKVRHPSEASPEWWAEHQAKLPDGEETHWTTSGTTSCFAPLGSTIVDYKERVGDRRRMEVTTSDYLPGTTDRVVYKHLENLASATTREQVCRRDAHIYGAFDYAFIEEDGRRIDRRYKQDFEYGSPDHCSAKVTQQCAIQAGGTFAPATTTGSFQVTPSPVCDWESPDANDDLISQVDLDSSGRVTHIEHRGGDPDHEGERSAYGVGFTWQSGVANSFQLDSIGYKGVQHTISPAGFVTASENANGLVSEFTFDDLGRILTIDPPGNSEYGTVIRYGRETRTEPVTYEAWTIEIASSATASSAAFDPSDGTQSWEKLVFDGLGREIEAWKALADGTRAVRLKRYDTMGRVVFESGWMTESAWQSAPTIATPWCNAEQTWCLADIPTRDGRPWGTVTFFGEPSTAPGEENDPLRVIADPLGRVHRVVAADGSVTTTTYCGPHEEVAVSVGTSIGGDGIVAESPVRTRYYKDGRDRLVLVDVEPFAGEGSSHPAADAAYRYDPLGNLEEVRLVDNLPAQPFEAWLGDTISGGQIRRFEYDSLGNLRRVDIPEQDGVVGFGGEEWDTLYDAYDAWGKPLIWRDATSQALDAHWRASYDTAGRLIRTELVAG